MINGIVKDNYDTHIYDLDMKNILNYLKPQQLLHSCENIFFTINRLLF